MVRMEGRSKMAITRRSFMGKVPFAVAGLWAIVKRNGSQAEPEEEWTDWWDTDEGVRARASWREPTYEDIYPIGSVADSQIL